MERDLREFVFRRALMQCEYCRMPQEFSDATHQIDHIIAEQHRGPTTPENLALACFHCNNHKGPNIAGIDPDTGSIAHLFHPCVDRWAQHFFWKQAILIGLSPTGRATIETLAINVRHRVLHRQSLIEEGVFPPKANSKDIAIRNENEI